MSKARVESFSISLDGFSAGPEQSLEHPLGVGGEGLHAWAFSTKTFQQEVFGTDGGATGLDDDYAARGFTNIGAWILGRNMFSPTRGPWQDPAWRGWWGENPPFHSPVFVLTHHPREALEMEGGTVFHFVTGGPLEAMERARAAAGTRDVRIGGGAHTIREYVHAGLVDEMHLAIAPVLLGRGERLFDGIDLRGLGFHCTEHAASPLATHVVLTRMRPR